MPDSHRADSGSGLLPYTDPCLTPQEFLGVLIGSDNICRCDRHPNMLVKYLFDPQFCHTVFGRHVRTVFGRHIRNAPRNPWGVRHGSLYGSGPDSLSAPCESLASETSQVETNWSYMSRKLSRSHWRLGHLPASNRLPPAWLCT